MRLFLKNRTRGQIEFGIVYGGIALLVLMAARVMPLNQLAPSCVLQGLTGIPCPTCGSTRSLVFLAHGDLFMAFLMNPVVFAACIAANLVLLYSIITLIPGIPRVGIHLSNKEITMLKAGVVCLFLVNWAYLIVTLRTLP
jgi:hypothetical protein